METLKCLLRFIPCFLGHRRPAFFPVLPLILSTMICSPSTHLLPWLSPLYLPSFSHVWSSMTASAISATEVIFYRYIDIFFFFFFFLFSWVFAISLIIHKRSAAFVELNGKKRQTVASLVLFSSVGFSHNPIIL